MYLYYTVITILISLIIIGIFPSIKDTVYNFVISCFYKNKEKKQIINEKTNKTKENFNSAGKVVFSSYTAEWCPHCVTFKSQTFGTLSNMFNGNNRIIIKNVDCTNDRTGNTRTPAGNPIEGYPTLIVNTYDANNVMKEIPYNGPRDANSIANYLRNL
jgi:thiol:disulfide interchange protein